MRDYQDEFPLLSALGLYAAKIRGDGNCLFNALSDQLYGNQNEHKAIRARVISYMREHADYYKQFVEVRPGGGVRRNPKRKNAGAYSTPVNLTVPTREEIDRVFEAHLQRMAKGGTYGDNMEITAFSAAYDVDVKIYQRDFAFMVSSVGGSNPDERRQSVHIAYHSWEHYSSIRNLDGPHTGLPHVRVRILSPDEEKRQCERLASTPRVLPWMIDTVAHSLPFLVDKPTIKRTLEEFKGNIDAAVSRLLDGEEGGTSGCSSAHESSSVEREADSDDELAHGPNKRRDRRSSRITRTSVFAGKGNLQVPHRRGLASCVASNSSFTSSADSLSAIASGIPLPASSPSTDPYESGSESDWKPPTIFPPNTTAFSTKIPPSPHVYAASTTVTPVRKGPTRIKLNPPKPLAKPDGDPIIPPISHANR